jgi:hypothetical protein
VPTPTPCAVGLPTPEKAWQAIDLPKGSKPYGTAESINLNSLVPILDGDFSNTGDVVNI